jgi:hypothetical protein
MRQNIHKRLEVLEKTNAALQVQKTAGTDGAAAIRWVRDILQACGVEQQPMESLAEAFARCLGISPRELDSRLRSIACPQ